MTKAQDGGLVIGINQSIGQRTSCMNIRRLQTDKHGPSLNNLGWRGGLWDQWPLLWPFGVGGLGVCVPWPSNMQGLVAPWSRLA